MAKSSDSKFEIEKNLAIVHLPQSIKVARIYFRAKRVEIVMRRGKPVIKTAEVCQAA